ncbi:MAG TPA: CoA-transferase [Pseudonocardiaceae bacterium]|jgi:acyl CoA:acetate/3-ketoacid CoA transferase alpha subunit/acyl CoA:acetate/3-ketoacid CoA transferase beta subunit|nr:CoA-transferase [Pseudonocardiaceae bacterium]
MAVLPLGEAIARFTRPGMAIHLGYGGGRPNAAVAELIRRYRGTSPGFTVSAHGFVNTQHALVAAGLVRRLVVAYAGENYPSPRPNPALQRAVRDGSVEVASWSLWTLTARLVAGALGVEFFPVRSLAGSGMAAEHEGTDYRTVEAFDGTTGVVRAYRPDLVLLQGIAADTDGNVLLPPPYGEGAWGALAAREGVIACVERIVDADVIRAHNSLPSVPAHVVRAVCVTPFGSHPYGMDTGGLADVPGYGEDEPFMAGLRRAAKRPDTFDEWISEWVIGPTSHEEFLALLGSQRLDGLLADSRAEAASRTGPPSEDERMTMAAVRVLRDRVAVAGHDIVLSGIGFAHLAAWTAVSGLRAQGTAVQLAAELGMSGFTPLPGDPYLFARQNLPTSLRLTDVMGVLARDVSGPATSSIGVLGAGQMDREGNINSTWSAGGDYLVGSGGANDVASAADEVVVVVKHARDRMVDHVGYVTAPGHRVSTVVTSQAVLERQGDAFTVVRFLADTDTRSAIAQIQADTGWDIAVRPDVAREPPPDPADLTLLRSYDPAGVFLR